jgi:hypothetical protein
MNIASRKSTSGHRQFRCPPPAHHQHPDVHIVEDTSPDRLVLPVQRPVQLVLIDLLLLLPLDSVLLHVGDSVCAPVSSRLPCSFKHGNALHARCAFLHICAASSSRRLTSRARHACRARSERRRSRYWMSGNRSSLLSGDGGRLAAMKSCRFLSSLAAGMSSSRWFGSLQASSGPSAVAYPRSWFARLTF